MLRLSAEASYATKEASLTERSKILTRRCRLTETLHARTRVADTHCTTSTTIKEPSQRILKRCPFGRPGGWRYSFRTGSSSPVLAIAITRRADSAAAPHIAQQAR